MRRAPRRILAPLPAVVLAVALGASCSGGGGAEAPPPTEPPTTTTEAPLSSGTPVQPATYDPAIGDCFDRRVPDPERPLEEVILILSCELPHTFEVFDLWQDETPPGEPLTEEEAFRRAARSRCAAGMEEFSGTTYELSVLEVEALTPSPSQWELGVRTMACVAYHRDGDRITGSARGSDL